MMSSSRTGGGGGGSTMSTTAKLILDTLERMSTPVRDAQKIPVPRAERRRQVRRKCLIQTVSKK